MQTERNYMKSETYFGENKNKLQENYKQAQKKHTDKSYFCANESGYTERNLDLPSPYVFCDQQPNKKKNNNLWEYKLQAYIVKTLLKTEKLGSFKDWKLLDAERRIEKADLLKTDKHQRFDLLVCAGTSFIVLELKAVRSTKAFDELDAYVNMVKEYLSELNRFYSCTAKEVKGYTVWPHCQTGRARKLPENPWGILEYSLRDLKELKNNGTLAITLIKEAKE